MKKYVGGLGVARTLLNTIINVTIHMCSFNHHRNTRIFKIIYLQCRPHVTLTFAGPKNSLFATKFGGIMWGAKAGTDLFMALFMAVLMRSTGTGKMTVLLFSAEMLLRVCRYRSCRI